jgi:hypothetical protein
MDSCFGRLSKSRWGSRWSSEIDTISTLHLPDPICLCGTVSLTGARLSRSLMRWKRFLLVISWLHIPRHSWPLTLIQASAVNNADLVHTNGPTEFNIKELHISLPIGQIHITAKVFKPAPLSQIIAQYVQLYPNTVCKHTSFMVVGALLLIGYSLPRH